MKSREHLHLQMPEVTQDEDSQSSQESSQLVALRNKLREDIAPLARVIEKTEPNYWWPLVIRHLIRLRDKLEEYPPEEKEYLVKRYDLFVDLILDEIDIDPDDRRRSQIIQRAEIIIMSFSTTIAKDYWHEHEPIKENFISLKEMVAQYPHFFTLRRAKVIRADENKNTCWEEVNIETGLPENHDDNIYDFYFLGIKHPETGVLKELPLPIGEDIMHKGGPARLVLGLIQGAPIGMIKADFDWNDLDIISWGHGEKRVRDIADVMGVDPEGVEVFQQEEFNFSEYCYGRDTQQNQIALGAEGIYYSDGASLAAQTGKASIVGRYVPNKAIYGVDIALFSGYELIKSRGLMRLVKAVAEKKLVAYDYLPLNNDIDFGVYWLFLARKWSKRKNFGELMQRMLMIGKRMGQVSKGEEGIYDVLDRVHKQYPFFDLDRELTSMLDLVRWKTTKLAKQVDREFRWEFKVPTSLVIEPNKENTIYREIHLSDFEVDPEETEKIREEWYDFLDRCRERTHTFNAQERPYIEELFIFSDRKSLGRFFELRD